MSSSSVCAMTSALTCLVPSSSAPPMNAKWASSPKCSRIRVAEYVGFDVDTASTAAVPSSASSSSGMPA